MEQWEVQRSQGQCHGTGEPLQPGQEYYAALIDLTDTFERRDYSCDYWDQQLPQVFSYWKTHAPLPNQKKKLFVDNDLLINLFERLADETELVKINFRFVLTLILMRKRLIKYLDSRQEDQEEIWNVQLVRDKQDFSVVNPQLDDSQIEEVSKQLSTILQGEV
jgi:hypothetical protein